MRRDLIVKLLFVVAEPAQIGLQMVLAITTFTGLLHNCFRTRPCIIGRQGLRLVVTLRRLELTISGLRGQLPVQLEDRAIFIHNNNLNHHHYILHLQIHRLSDK